MRLIRGGGTEALASDEQPKTGSITIQNAIEGATYNFYRIADLTLTDSGNPEDGVSYTMSAEQCNHWDGYKDFNFLVPYNEVKYYYEFFKSNPEEWPEDEMGIDADSAIKIYENMLASPISVNNSSGIYCWSLLLYLECAPDVLTTALAALTSPSRGVSPDYSQKAANGEVIAENLPLGYYIIIPDSKSVTAEDAIIPINITNLMPNKVVKSKAIPLSINKTANVTNASIGDIITFCIEGTVPSYNYLTKPTGLDSGCFMYFSDTMQGMKLTGDWSLTIDDQPAKDYWNSTFTFNSSDQQWQDSNFLNEYKSLVQAQPDDFEIITIHGDRAEDVRTSLTNITIPTTQESSFSLGYRVDKSDIGKPFKFTYSAIITEDANRGLEGNPNDAMVIYFDETSDGSGYEIYTAEDQETVYTYDINLLKYADGDTSKVLPGAQFALYKQDEEGNKLYYKLTEDATLVEGKDLIGPKVTWVDIGSKTINQAIADGDITAVTSGQDGKTAFTGIPHDTYYLQEIKAPEGYNLMVEDKVVELAADAPADFEVQVENTGGALLPETGGPGTALFTMMGLLLMAGAAAIYLSHRKQQQ